ncbi:hypothetical protein C9I86_19460 [Photobacterium sp. NCIMB 13483]|uniref:ATP-binding protein n=1 Tax=Photobacterium sp. NCIMB 13483 TaxID=2022103 RepID=UPI000D15CFE4|nr:ATP-binding protein [Photobacterium sp. NCIMB 13483]PST85361.1 hypothetical protein C9I86_19460 [Photobacterium sp. NCIMB 13483]
MKFKKLRVHILADDGLDYGYNIKFEPNLNIIRGDNSSGKSTFVNSLIYSLGMEEIIGSKGLSSLPYALKSEFEFEGRKIKIVNSVVYVEIENNSGTSITLKRSIKSEYDDVKLIQIIKGPYLSNSGCYDIQPTFLHDAGSAQDPERGFFAFLENFIGLKMPSVNDTKGKQTKLYLQSIFAALIIEQKRGWTDYIANIPYYNVSGMREKVSSFLLDLNVFRNAKALSDYSHEKNKIVSEWSEVVTSIKLLAETNHLSISGINKNPVVDFNLDFIRIGEYHNDEFQSLNLIKTSLSNKIIEKEEKSFNKLKKEAPEIVPEIEKIKNRMDELLTLQTMSSQQININKSQCEQYILSLSNIEKDLKDNKLTQKLVDFGANVSDINIAKGICGTCFQSVEDILLPPDSQSIPMSINENIVHLDNQKKMTKSLIDGLEKTIIKDKFQLRMINNDLISLRKELSSLTRDLKSINNVKESDVRIKIEMENKRNNLSFIENKINEYLDSLSKLSKSYREILTKIKSVDKSGFTGQDYNKVKMFTTSFKHLAENFGYRSASVSDINIEPSSMLPYLGGIELRETKSEHTDIKSDSSASDFVRLIWSYLISLQATSIYYRANHPNFILFDEPAQHSMSEKSVNKLLNSLCYANGLQSIIAASFDESDENFEASTSGIKGQFNLIRLPSKIIERLF